MTETRIVDPTEQSNEFEVIKQNLAQALSSFKSSLGQLNFELQKAMAEGDLSVIGKTMTKENPTATKFHDNWEVDFRENVYTGQLKKLAERNTDAEHLLRRFSPIIHDMGNNMTGIDLEACEYHLANLGSENSARAEAKIMYEARSFQSIMNSISQYTDLLLSYLTTEGLADARKVLVENAYKNMDKLKEVEVAKVIESVAQRFPKLTVTIQEKGSQNQSLFSNEEFLVSALENILKNAGEAGAKNVNVVLILGSELSRIEIEDDGQGVSNTGESNPARLEEINAKLSLASRLEDVEPVSPNENKRVSQGHGMENVAQTIGLYHGGTVQLEEIKDGTGKLKGIRTIIQIHTKNAKQRVEKMHEWMAQE